MAREAVFRPAAIGTQDIIVCTGEVLRCHAFRLGGFGKRGLVEIALGGVIGRSAEIEDVFLFVPAVDAGDVEIPFGKEGLVAVEGNAVQVPPAVFLAGPQKGLAAVEPVPAGAAAMRPERLDVDPGVVGFIVDRLRFTGCGITEIEDAVVLCAVELLDRKSVV